MYYAQWAWADWQRKLAVKLGASTFLQQAAAKPKDVPAHAGTALPTREAPTTANLPPLTVPRPQMSSNHPDSSSPITSQYMPSAARGPIRITPPSSSPPNFRAGSKRPASYNGGVDSDEEWGPRPTKYKKDTGFGYMPKKPKNDYIETPIPVLSREERFELDQLEKNKAPEKPLVEEDKIKLTPEQDKVVDLALRKNNIFLTGAAGSGKTVTLKEILRRIRKRKKGGKVEVIAPTGIAALPLGGKTTYSFAGWHPDSFRKGIAELLDDLKQRPGVRKAITELDTLVIEEISMVENQFLERLNLLFQTVLKNTLPFGGKQVIFLGDFHQLPPVQPFKNCMQCGQEIPRKEVPKCPSPKCNLKQDTGDADIKPAPQNEFTWGDKWAFKSSIWSQLKLRHIKLEQIHRQKDTSFQDILNKIRNGVTLSVDEWHQLERPKVLPKDAYAVRLMSRLAQVKSFNEQKLAELTSQPKTWRAHDSAEKLIAPLASNNYKVKEYKDSLKDHRLPEELTLKVGARVVLLQNLAHDKGLVNGSQGVVIGFAPSQTEGTKNLECAGPHQAFRAKSVRAFQAGNVEMRPLVRFANGQTALITTVAQASVRGDVLDPHEQYVLARTQLPLTLAWALSIHKSQGMTLEYVEVLSKDIFETGQLYVALSRATHLNGLRVTGFKREQLPMDMDVMQFYNETNWEKLERPAPKKKRAQVIDLT